MGLFDSLKKIVANTASNAIDDALNQVKTEATNAVKEEIQEKNEEIQNKIKQKTEEAIVGGVKSYLNNAKENVDTEDGKEAINVLQNLVDDANNAKKAATSGENNNIDYVAKTQDDLTKLAEIADKYDNNQTNYE